MKQFKLQLVALLWLVGSLAAFGQERVYPVGDFNSIDASNVVDIHFTQGPVTKVTGKCRVGDIGWLVVKNKGGVLTISTDRKMSRGGRLKVDLYVTSPKLERIGISGLVSFEAATLDVPSLAVDISGVGTVAVKEIKSGNVKLNLSGKSRFTSDIRGGSLDVGNSGVSNVSITFSGNNARVKNSGSSVADITFRGDAISIKNSGVAKMKADVDCKRLKISNSGASTLTIKGTADDTKVDGDGVSKINTEGLNRF